jgi:zinc protease
LESAIDAVIANVADKGVTDDELNRAKTRLIADAVYAHDSQSSMARWYGEALATGSSVAEIDSWPDRIRKVTPDQVREAARTWLIKQRSVTGYLVKDLGANRS